jgi:hypothetical protein
MSGTDSSKPANPPTGKSSTTCLRSSGHGRCISRLFRFIAIEPLFLSAFSKKKTGHTSVAGMGSGLKFFPAETKKDFRFYT